MTRARNLIATVLLCASTAGAWHSQAWPPSADNLRASLRFEWPYGSGIMITGTAKDVWATDCYKAGVAIGRAVSVSPPVPRLFLSERENLGMTGPHLSDLVQTNLFASGGYAGSTNLGPISGIKDFIWDLCAASNWVDLTWVDANGSLTNWFREKRVYQWTTHSHTDSEGSNTTVQVWELTYPIAPPLLTYWRLMEICGLPFTKTVVTEHGLFTVFGWQVGAWSNYTTLVSQRVVTNYSQTWFNWTPVIDIAGVGPSYSGNHQYYTPYDIFIYDLGDPTSQGTNACEYGWRHVQNVYSQFQYLVEYSYIGGGTNQIRDTNSYFTGMCDGAGGMILPVAPGYQVFVGEAEVIVDQLVQAFREPLWLDLGCPDWTASASAIRGYGRLDARAEVDQSQWIGAAYADFESTRGGFTLDLETYDAAHSLGRTNLTVWPYLVANCTYTYVDQEYNLGGTWSGCTRSAGDSYSVNTADSYEMAAYAVGGNDVLVRTTDFTNAVLGVVGFAECPADLLWPQGRTHNEQTVEYTEADRFLIIKPANNFEWPE